MPTPSAIRDIVRHRTNIAIGLSEAIRLARAAVGHDLRVELEIHGRDVRTGVPATAVLSVGDVLTASPLDADELAPLIPPPDRRAR